MRCKYADQTVWMFELEARTLLSATNFFHSTATLSQPRADVSATTVDGKGIFGGGFVLFGVSDVVDVYDGVRATWAKAKLTSARYQIGATTAGRKALFAGGSKSPTTTSMVDVFDSSSGRWSTSNLSRANTPSVSVSLGRKALFVGGQDLGSSHVDIYDDATGQWSAATLSESRAYPVGAAVGSTAYIGGGTRSADGRLSDVVDVYESRSGRWSVLHLPIAAHFDAATAVGDKVIFAGGYTIHKHGKLVDSDLVEAYDTRLKRWSVAKLSQARTEVSAVNVGHLAIFAGGRFDDRNGGHASDVVDIYDADTSKWTTTTLSEPRAAIGGTAVGGAALFAGGYVPSPFGGAASVLSTVDILTPDNVAPVSTLVFAPSLDRTATTYTFSVSYHDRNGIDASTIDDRDVFVTGPGGFSRAATVVSQARGKHGSTRIVTYAVRGRDLRWDAGDNGTYTIRLHSRQVRDTAGNPAKGDDLGEFKVQIPSTLHTSVSRALRAATGPFQSKRKINDLLEA